MIIEKLKRNLSEQHACLEKTNVAMKIVSPNVNLEDYKRFLSAMWLGFSVVEPRLSEAKFDDGNDSESGGFSYEGVSELLTRDLEDLGVPVDELERYGQDVGFGPPMISRQLNEKGFLENGTAKNDFQKRCLESETTNLGLQCAHSQDRLQACLAGVRYVAEGSALGGIFLSKYLRTKLDFDQLASRFLDCGRERVRRFDILKEYYALKFDDKDLKDMIAGGKIAFHVFSQAFQIAEDISLADPYFHPRPTSTHIVKEK